MTEAERRETLSQMVVIAKGVRDRPDAGPMERKAAHQIADTAARCLASGEPSDPWMLGHIIIDWGLLDLTKDLRPQFTQLAAVRAGKASGKTRQQKAAEQWHGHALDLAISGRADKPSLSQKNLAADIQAAWKNDGDIPGLDSLLNFVRASEQAGTLPKRKV